MPNQKTSLLLMVACLLGFASSVAHAQLKPGPQLRPNFVRLEPPRPVPAGDRIELIEFFYYGCPVCYELQPKLTRWLVNAPADVVLRRVPALATASWETFARLFYALEALGEIDRLHWPVYDNFHFDNINLSDETVMAEWVGRNGIDRQKFVEAYGSPEIQARVVAAREMVRMYEVKGVPGFVVDGRFLTSAGMAGSTDALMPLVDKLIDMARRERAR